MECEITVFAEVENLKDVNDFLAGKLQGIHCSQQVQMQLEIALEEIFVNIASYAYHPKSGKAKVKLIVDEERKQISIRFEDTGRPYNPLQRGDPDITLGVEEREVGGLGIYMAKKTMDQTAYRYENGKNILTITKKLK